nr:YcaO-like family protein [Pyrobaculum arsenaticum]
MEGGERPLAPGQVAAFGYRLAKGEDLIGYSSSGGLALGVGLEALYRGALEFVERDAVNLGWHSDIPPFRIRITLEEALRLIGVRLCAKRRGGRRWCQQGYGQVDALTCSAS